ncbi:MAG: ATP-binding protein, partial [Candidatus Binatia bacterium]
MIPAKQHPSDIFVFHTRRPESAREPFVGRRREIADLEAGLQGTLAGRGRLFLVLGEPGIGKTRLADEIASRARARGLTAVWGRCWEAGGAPAYWPWTQAVRAVIAALAPEVLAEKLGVGAHRLAEILPELRATIPGLDGPAASALDSADARFYFFDAVTSFLASVAAERPLLVIVDDLHRADRPSLLLLRFLARELSKVAIEVIATAREFEARSDPDVARLFDEIARDATSMTLGGLSLEDSAALIETSLGTLPPQSVVRSLHETTDGNPYCRREIARLIHAEIGSARRARWKSFRLPADTRAAIGRRLDRLEAECRRVLSIASVAGREFALAPLREVTGLAEAPLLDALAEAERAGLLRSGPREGRRRGFSHALVREALYEELSPAHRARLHREIGESLERLYDADRSAHAAEIAHHLFEAARGGLVDEKAIDSQRRAGERAVALLAWEEGAAHYRRALDLLDLGATDERLRCELLLVLGEASSKGGDLGGARGAFTQAAALARSIRSAEHLARAAVG